MSLSVHGIIVSLGVLSFYAATVLAFPHNPPGSRRRRVLRMSTDEEIKRVLWEGYGRTNPTGLRGNYKECQLIKLKWNEVQWKDWGDVSEAPGTMFGASGPLYTFDHDLAGFFNEASTMTTLDRNPCFGKGVFNLYGDENQIMIDYTCSEELNPISGGGGKFACATGVETFECGSDGVCVDYIFLCGDGCKAKQY